jgi:hypothetical protein
MAIHTCFKSHGAGFSIELIQTGFSEFTVKYGLQIKRELSIRGSSTRAWRSDHARRSLRRSSSIHAHKAEGAETERTFLSVSAQFPADEKERKNPDGKQ